MSKSIISLEQNLKANNVDKMMFEPCLLAPPTESVLGIRKIARTSLPVAAWRGNKKHGLEK